MCPLNRCILLCGQTQTCTVVPAALKRGSWTQRRRLPFKILHPATSLTYRYVSMSTDEKKTPHQVMGCTWRVFPSLACTDASSGLSFRVLCASAKYPIDTTCGKQLFWGVLLLQEREGLAGLCSKTNQLG